MKIFIGGSKSVSQIDDSVKEKLSEMIKNGSEILIGDCRGIDTAVQQFFSKQKCLTITRCFMLTINEFVEKISSEKGNEECENFYQNHIDRQYNLQVYLNEMRNLNPKILFVGEAPGYLGCAKTGIPFTDERVIREYDLLPGQYKLDGYRKEKTAKAMWDILREVDKLPLFWNAFPLHPHMVGNTESNRTPSNQEIERGTEYIRYIMEIFDIEKVYAVGLKSFNCLRQMNIKEFSGNKAELYIRHPSFGGKEQCRAKIKEIFCK